MHPPVSVRDSGCPGGGGGGKEEVVSLRGVNHGFWSHLGRSGGKSPPFPDVKVSFRVVN